MVENTDKALALTCAAHHCTIADYTVAPIFMDSISGKGGHEWLVEFETPPLDMADFARDLDAALQSLNSDYEAKRYKSIALLPLKLNVAPRHTFSEWLRQRGRFGGQSKIPRLSNDRTYLTSILAIQP